MNLRSSKAHTIFRMRKLRENSRFEVASSCTLISRALRMRLTLKSSDGIRFEVEDVVLLEMNLLCNLFSFDFGVSSHVLLVVELLSLLREK